MGTDTTTSTTPKTPQLLDARRILALIALAVDLPVPRLIDLNNHSAFKTQPLLALHLRNLSDASRWATWLGATKTTTRASRDRTTTSFEHSDITWHGWEVYVFADEKATPDTTLDADTRAQLEQVAAVTVDDTAGGV